MFSSEDVREINQLFPSPKSHIATLPSLILASNGQGFITIRHLLSDFESHVKSERGRLSISSLAESLEVEPSIVSQIIRSHAHHALISSDGSKVVPQTERDDIQTKLRELLSDGLISKQRFATDNDIDLKSLDLLLEEENELVEGDGHVYTKSYDQKLSDSVLDILTRTINNTTHSNLPAHDASQFPGSPPIWLVLQHSKQAIQTHHFENDIFIRENSAGFRIQSTKVKEVEIQALVQPLLDGEIAYIDLQTAVQNTPEIFSSIEDLRSALTQLQELEIIQNYALSKPWQRSLLSKAHQTLQETGILNPSSLLPTALPEVLHVHLIQQTSNSLLSSTPTLHSISPFILTPSSLDAEKSALLEFASTAAHSQWQTLQSSPTHVLKFSLPTTAPPLYTALLKDKPTEKATEEAFWAAISPLESQNEHDFETFWTQRLARIATYQQGLTSIADTKLHSQLSGLLATYLQTDYLPDTLSKARTQGLVLSRRTRKNVARLETALQTLDLSAGKESKEEEGEGGLDKVIQSLDTFAKKQTILFLSSISPTALAEAKVSMLTDMQRKLSKPPQPSGKKTSDAPVLFLTLVIMLHARLGDGVVYATGKFAPRLLKGLKGRVGEGEYEKLEGWKEGAKGGGLSVGDREGMREMGGKGVGME